MFCIFCPNLVVLASIGVELWWWLAQNGVKFYFKVQSDLEGQSQSTPKTTGILTKVFYISGPNLVILAEQVRSYRTDKPRVLRRMDGRKDGRTHRQAQATTKPKGQNWPWIEIHWCDNFNWNIKIKLGDYRCHKYICQIQHCWLSARLVTPVR